MADTTAILLGDLSGLQAFLFAVPSADGGQAKKLRARSFYLQLLTEVALLRVLETTGWDQKQVIFCGAGRFALQGPALSAEEVHVLKNLERELGLWLHVKLGGLLTLSLALAQGETADVALWQEAQHWLHQQKAAPARRVLQNGGIWDASRLTLPPVYLSGDNTPIVPAASVMDETVVGQALPRAAWVLISRKKPAEAGIEVFDQHWTCLTGAAMPDITDVIAAYALRQGMTALAGIQIIPRQLARHLPRTQRGEPLTFEQMANLGEGDAKLGILAMDVDRLGEAFARQEQHGLKAVSDLSQKLDRFFSQHIQQNLRNWKLDGCTYILFAGGDDFIAIGKWDKMLELAGKVQEAFQEEFENTHITISAGLAVTSPKFPVHRSVQQAQELLEKAKAKGGDCCAALGQAWKWKVHEVLNHAARTWFDLVNSGVADRGWLQTLLQATESAFHPDPLPPSAPSAARQARRTARALAHARLVAFAKRAIRPKKGNPQASNIVDALIADFESKSMPTTFFMPAICRWALGLTRSRSDD